MEEFIEINRRHFKNYIERKLNYRVIDEDDNSMMIHFGYKKSPCGIIMIDDNTAVIISLSNFIKCTNPPLQKGVGMYGIMRAMIFKILEFRIQKKINFEIIEFTDNSTILVDHYQLYLADAHRLISGNTWYQDILPELQLVPKNAIEYQKWQDDKLKLNQIKTNSIQCSSIFPKNENIEKIWNSFANKNIKEAFKEIRNQEPILWAQYYENAIHFLKLHRLHGIDFITHDLPIQITTYFRV